MEAFTTHTGRAVPLRRSNVDTDQIIPAHWLKKVTRDGFEDGLFEAWRKDPEFVLNRPERQGATVLVAGPDFGTGSSREHAVWALQNYGFKAVISARFADIFRGNSLKNGLLTVVLPQQTVDRLWELTEADPSAERLKEAHSRVRSLQVPEDVRMALSRKLLIITAATKHDLNGAARRLKRF